MSRECNAEIDFVYLFTLGTNAIIISTIVLDRALHTPMYFFLGVLSCSETFYTFVIVPKMLVDLLAQKKTISFLGCAIQMFSFLFLGCSHSFLLAAMGYDRYVAICAYWQSWARIQDLPTSTWTP